MSGAKNVSEFLAGQSGGGSGGGGGGGGGTVGYAEIFATAGTQALSTTPTKLTGPTFADGDSDDAVLDANAASDQIDVIADCVAQIDLAASVDLDAGAQLTLQVAVDGSLVPGILFVREVPINDVGAGSACGIVSLTAGQRVEVFASVDAGTPTLDPTVLTLRVTTIGGVGATGATGPTGPAGPTDHGGLTGLADDDHTQYLLADGTRALTGNLATSGTFDGRDVAADGSQLDTNTTKLASIEDNADVTDATNVDAAGAVMESHITGATGIMRRTGTSTQVASDTVAAGIGTTVTTVTDGATLTLDCSLGNSFVVTLAGNRTVAAPTNPRDGQTIIFKIIQDATGSRTLTWNATFNWPGGVAPTLSTAASAVDIVSAWYDGTNWWATSSLAFS